MQKWLRASSFAFALASLTSPALAEDASTSELPPRRSSVSVGSGVMVVPNLEALSDAPLSGTLIPVLLEAGAFVTEHLELGGLAQLAPSLNLDRDRSGVDLRFGATARYHIAPRARVAPWFGLSLGYEHFSSDRAMPVRADGVFSLLQAGLDWRATRDLSLGPYLALGPTLGSSTSVLHAHDGDVSTTQPFLVFSGTAGARVALSF